MITQEQLNSWYEHKSNKERTIEAMDRLEDEKDEDVCQFCEGVGEIYEPARQEGGEIVGPDSHPCPVCQTKEEEQYEPE